MLRFVFHSHRHHLTSSSVSFQPIARIVKATATAAASVKDFFSNSLATVEQRERDGKWQSIHGAIAHFPLCVLVSCFVPHKCLCIRREMWFCASTSTFDDTDNNNNNANETTSFGELLRRKSTETKIVVKYIVCLTFYGPIQCFFLRALWLTLSSSSPPSSSTAASVAAWRFVVRFDRRRRAVSSVRAVVTAVLLNLVFHQHNACAWCVRISSSYTHFAVSIRSSPHRP